MTIGKQCPEGLIFKEPALLQDGYGKAKLGDRTTEYRCELDSNHTDWHEDGDHRWKTY